MGSSSGLKWALGLSVVVNLFLIAAAIGAVIVVQHHMSEFKRPMPPSGAWHDATKTLTPEEKQQLYTLIKTAALSGEPDMDKARDLRTQVSTVSMQQPYNAVKVAQLSEQARGYENDARAKVENALITGMGTMTPVERGIIAGHLLRPSFRFHSFASKDHKPGDPDVPPTAGATASH